jgi:hypothetical protein
MAIETVYQFFPDIASCLRQFGRGWPSIFAEAMLLTDAPLQRHRDELAEPRRRQA